MKEIQNVNDLEMTTYDPPFTFKAGEVKKVSDEDAARLLSNHNFKEVKKEVKEVKEVKDTKESKK
jgi:hypothetical protein